MLEIIIVSVVTSLITSCALGIYNYKTHTREMDKVFDDAVKDFKRR
jgi:hypothetical protein